MKHYYDPNKAGRLDDETPFMGTYDYCPPSDSLCGHFRNDVVTHWFDGDYAPGLTHILDRNDPNALLHHDATGGW